MKEEVELVELLVHMDLELNMEELVELEWIIACLLSELEEVLFMEVLEEGKVQL